MREGPVATRSTNKTKNKEIRITTKKKGGEKTRASTFSLN